MDKEKQAQAKAAAQLLIEQWAELGLEVPEAVKQVAEGSVDQSEESPIEEQSAEENEQEKSSETPKSEQDSEKLSEEQESQSQPNEAETSKGFVSKADFLKSKGCPFDYDERTDTFKMDLAARVCASVKSEDNEDGYGLVKAAFGSKAGNAPDFEPTDEEYQKILSFTGKNYPKDAFKVYYVTAATNEVDRHSEHFSNKALESMARLAVDQPFIKDHNRYNSDGVVGKIFDSKVAATKEGGAKRLLLKVYMHKTPEKQALFDGIESGENNKVSISARFKNKDLVCDVCHKGVYDWNAAGGPCPHYPGQEIENGGVATACYKDIIDFMECSRVTTPAQKPAAIKSFDEQALAKSSDPLLLNAKATEELADQLKQLNKSSEEAAKSDQNLDSNENTTIPAVKQNVAEESVVDEKLEKLIDAFQSSLDKIADLVSKNTEVAESLKSSCEKLCSDVEESKKQFAAKEEFFNKQVAETRQLVSTTLGLHKNLVENVYNLTGKSMEDLRRDILSHIKLDEQKKANESKSDTWSDRDKSLKNVDDGDFYKSTIQRIG